MSAADVTTRHCDKDVHGGKGGGDAREQQQRAGAAAPAQQLLPPMLPPSAELLTSLAERDLQRDLLVSLASGPVSRKRSAAVMGAASPSTDGDTAPLKKRQRSATDTGAGAGVGATATAAAEGTVPAVAKRRRRAPMQPRAAKTPEAEMQRVASAELAAKRKAAGLNSSQYHGVSFSASNRRWTAHTHGQIHGKGQRSYKGLGTFDDEVDAARAYDTAIRQESAEAATEARSVWSARVKNFCLVSSGLDGRKLRHCNGLNFPTADEQELERQGALDDPQLLADEAMVAAVSNHTVMEFTRRMMNFVQNDGSFIFNITMLLH